MAIAGRPNAESVRKVVEERLTAAEGPGLRETVTVEWRGSLIPLPVITMPVSLLAYNPDTHRVRAQRSLDAGRDASLTETPWGEEAQAYLHHLLMGNPSDPERTDPDFEALKEDIRLHGQRDPGLIDRTGILVNGNTRRAALKELGQENIRVGVLPSDAGLDDLQAVELSLQLRKDHRRDYSFMNTLLAIDERIKAGWPVEKVIREFRIRKETFERNRWILDTVYEAIARSRIVGEHDATASMRLVDFETHQGKLEELYGAYKTLKAKSPEDAEALKEQRLLAIALDKSKTDVRLIEADFAKHKKLQALLPATPTTSATPVVIPGLSVTAPPPSARVEQLKELTTRVLQAKAAAASPTVVSPGTHIAATDHLTDVRGAIEEALEQAGKDVRLKKRRLAPVDRLSDANEYLQLTIDAIADARSTGNFQPGDLDDALMSLRSLLVRVAQQVARSEGETGAGLDWLKRAAELSLEN